MTLLLAIGCCCAAAVLTALVRRYAVARAVVDLPNERSLHRVPTPRGGGLAVALVVLAAHAGLLGAGLLERGTGLAWGLGAAGLGLLGWVDDHRPLGAGLRFGVQLVILGTIVGFGSNSVAGHGLGGVLGAGLATLGLVWFVNLYNFMDGADGLAATQTILTAALLAALALAAGARGPGLALLALAAASAGFLRHNFPPATIFLGDVGSYFIGGYLGLYLWQHVLAGGTPWPWLVALSPFLTDATLTLIARVLAGERWWMPHRDHAYQRLVRMGWSHTRLVTAWGFYGLPSGALAWLAAQHPALGPGCALLAAATSVIIWRMIVVVTSRRAAC